MTAPLLQVRGLAKHFTLHLRGGLTLPVLEGIDFDLHEGECLALVGASGRGKSTLVKCLYGSYGADAGTLHYRRADGRVIDLAAAPPRTMLALREAEIGYVSQFLRAPPRVAADEVAAGDPARLEAARALLARLNLPTSLWPLPPATFSGGEQQRVNIARGFVRAARLLLLDEPTASLDAANRRAVIQLIREARDAGTAIVGIFHDDEVRDAVASRCLHFG